MATNLYLLHLRSEILPENFTSYRLINDKTALVELESKNKDFTTELVMTFSMSNRTRAISAYLTSIASFKGKIFVLHLLSQQTRV